MRDIKKIHKNSLTKPVKDISNVNLLLSPVIEGSAKKIQKLSSFKLKERNKN